jgi:hypothetical protein
MKNILLVGLCCAVNVEENLRDFFDEKTSLEIDPLDEAERIWVDYSNDLDVNDGE